MTTAVTTVVVQFHPQGHWEIMRPDRRGPITCETLEDARRIAYISVAHTHRCELIVRDAYNRVIDHELIDGYRRAGSGAST
jgi:hypothetical protein